MEANITTNVQTEVLGSKYELINGVLYRKIDAKEIGLRIEQILPHLIQCTEGINTCKKSIQAFTEQKSKYELEIDRLCTSIEVDKDLIKQIAPEKASLLGF